MHRSLSTFSKRKVLSLSPIADLGNNCVFFLTGELEAPIPFQSILNHKQYCIYQAKIFS